MQEGTETWVQTSFYQTNKLIAKNKKYKNFIYIKVPSDCQAIYNLQCNQNSQSIHPLSVTTYLTEDSRESEPGPFWLWL